ncbi:866_t:CDS:2 [Paraglomus brasilianum]|uniref:866_t:CDS:1 n=1 Tax=Paraglomus brasilianum TaxID=144538 RepID=A0A9N8ZNR4_9GLOM|nr:866_t:CDS:2 [Paraglomus brasilianum]
MDLDVGNGEERAHGILQVKTKWDNYDEDEEKMIMILSKFSHVRGKKLIILQIIHCVSQKIKVSTGFINAKRKYTNPTSNSEAAGKQAHTL